MRLFSLNLKRENQPSSYVLNSSQSLITYQSKCQGYNPKLFGIQRIKEILALEEKKNQQISKPFFN